MKITGGGVFALFALGLAGLVGWQVYAKRKSIGAAVADTLEAVNPVSDQNVAYKAANSIAQAVTGNPDATLGTTLWEWFNPDTVALENAITAPVKPKTPTAATLRKLVNDTGPVGGYESAFLGLTQFPTYNPDDPLSPGYKFH